MAQLRHDFEKFKAADTGIILIVPNGRRMIEKHVQEYKPSYTILSDKGGAVAKQYGVAPKSVAFLTAFKPAVFLVDRSGAVMYAEYASSYVAEPDNRRPLAVLDQAAI